MNALRALVGDGPGMNRDFYKPCIQRRGLSKNEEQIREIYGKF